MDDPETGTHTAAEDGRAEPEEPRMGPSIVTVGETMALLGTPDHCLFRAGSFPSLTIGGAESNVAIAATRLGARTTWMGRLGDDDLGDLVERELRGQGVDVRARRDPEAPTGLMVKEHRHGRPTRVRYYRRHSAGSRLEAADLDGQILQNADIVHLTGITAALGETPRQALRFAVAAARAGSSRISFDVNYRATLWSPEAAAPVLRDLASAADVVFAGLEEAALLISGSPDTAHLEDPWAAAADFAEQLCALGPRTAVLKLGSLGALALVNGSVVTHDIVPIEPVDPVGAGDAFVGAFLAELGNGSSTAACLASGAAMGALVCAVPGDWEGALDWSTAPRSAAGAEVRR
jgi:2-dehydro-3-deoxygluconokinase